ncbi:MAG: DMT family transporter [Thermodesulfovibrionales bacterium]
MENIWVIWGLTSAFSLATSDALTKKAVGLHNEYLIGWLRLAISLPFLWLTLLMIPMPQLDRDFFQAFCISLPLEVAATILYVKALKSSPLSLTLPFLSLTPVFLILISYLLLGEEVSLSGAVGVAGIACGGYILNISDIRKGVWAPFAAIRRERGAVYMIIVSFIYAFTSSLGKMAIEHSSPLFFGAAYITALVILLTPIALYKGRNEVGLLFRNGAVRSSILPGLFQAIMIISHMTGMGLTKVAYLISVKRLSLLIGVVYGHLFFHEPGIRQRIAGTALMVAGFLLIVLSR